MAKRGKEAEELRRGIENLCEEYGVEVPIEELTDLLERIDARDSLAYLEEEQNSARAELELIKMHTGMRDTHSIGDEFFNLKQDLKFANEKIQELEADNAFLKKEKARDETIIENAWDLISCLKERLKA